MRILELSTESTVQMAHIQPLAQYLRKQGHEVVLACSDDTSETGQSFVEHLRRLGFEVLVIPIRRTIALWNDAVATAMLYRHLRARRFDIVHVQTAKAGMVGRVAARLARVPTVIYTAHAFPFHERLSPWRSRFYAFLERIAARLCDVIVVDSEAVKARGLHFSVAAPDHIRVIPMGVDMSKFDPQPYRADRSAIRKEFGLRPDALVVGTIARLVPDKGLDCLLHAVSRLAGRYPALQCLIVGEGLLRDELQALATRLGLRERVVFAGYRRDVPRVLSVLELFMLPTLREGFGVVFAEAMSMEVPVVASRIPPITEVVVDGQTGFLADVGSPEAFASAAGALLESDERREQMGRAGRQHVIEQFSQQKMCLTYEQLFLDYHAQTGQGVVHRKPARDGDSLRG